MIIVVSSGSGAEEWEGKSDRYVNIVEWNTVTVGLLWVLTFYWEWGQMNLVLIDPNGNSSAAIHQQFNRNNTSGNTIKSSVEQ